jgi:hypothetical protein
MHRAPRPVSRMTRINLFFRSKIAAFLGVFLASLGLIFGIVLSIFLIGDDGLKTDSTFDKILKQGTSGIGKITGVDVNNNVTVNGQHPTVISFRYQPTDFIIENRVEVAIPPNVPLPKVGDEVKIKHLDLKAILVDYLPFPTDMRLFLIGPAIVILIGLIFALYANYKVRRELFLYRFGNIQKAEVITAILKTYKHYDGITRINLPGSHAVIFYKYSTSHGQNMPGQSLSNDHSLLNLQSGEIIQILVSPKDESRSCLYPDSVAKDNGWVD